jgi:hypothetical protein
MFKILYNSNIVITTEVEFKEYVEEMTGNNTCHRPDISSYDVCDPCPYVKYCLCDMNTRTNSKRYRRKLKYN